MAPVVRGSPRIGRSRRLARGAVLMVTLVTTPFARGEQTCDTKTYPLSAANGRFEEHEDGTIVDLRSRLMWMRCSAGQTWSGKECRGDARSVDFPAAQTLVDEVNRGGTLFFSDWRLPRVPELASIAERQCENPRINLAMFPDTPAEFYWTTSTRPLAPEGFVFALSFGSEGIRYLDKQQVVHLRLVRDAR